MCTLVQMIADNGFSAQTQTHLEEIFKIYYRILFGITYRGTAPALYLFIDASLSNRTTTITSAATNRILRC